MKIIFVRHGEDDNRFRGGWSELDLTEEGILQAKLLARHLKENQPSYRISRLIASDLPRTLTTAKYISLALALPILRDPKLRETNNGVLAGMRNEEALMRYPGLFFSSLGMDEPYPGGESPSQFFHRIRNWFFDFVDKNKHSDDNILVVTHSGVIRIIYHLANGLTWSNKSRLFDVDHCSIHILNTTTMQFEAENQTEFLHEVL